MKLDFSVESHSFETSCPVVLEEETDVMRQVDVSGGLHIMQWATFRTSLAWVRRASARLQLVHARAGVLKNGSQYSDTYHSLFSSLREPLHDLGEWLEMFHPLSDELSLHLAVEVTDTPCMRSSQRAVIGSHAFTLLPHGWHVRDDAIIEGWKTSSFEDRVCGGRLHPTLIEPRVVYRGNAWHCGHEGDTDPDVMAGRMRGMFAMAGRGLAGQAAHKLDDTCQKAETLMRETVGAMGKAAA